MRNLLLIVLLPLIIACGPLDPEPWRGSIRATILDGGTERPLAGAVLLVYWGLLFPGLGDASYSFYAAREAIADKQGVAELPAPPMSWLPFGKIKPARIVVFKGGFDTFPGIVKATPSEVYQNTLVESRAEGTIIRLHELSSAAERRRVLGRAQPAAVPNESMPLLAASIREETRKLKSGTE